VQPHSSCLKLTSTTSQQTFKRVKHTLTRIETLKHELDVHSPTTTDLYEENFARHRRLESRHGQGQTRNLTSAVHSEDEGMDEARS
jgi:hypothetical protein